MSQPFHLALAVAGLAAVAAPGASQTPAPPAEEGPIIIVRGVPQSRDQIIRTVYIGDLDLKDEAGRKAMEERVDKAVNEMCAIPTPLPTYGEKMTKPCRDDAWASARPQMDRAVARSAGS